MALHLRQRPVRLMALAGLLALLFGIELLVPGRTLYRWDTLVYTWPLATEIRRQLLTGHWPFWADGVCCGTPLLGNPRAAALYPLNLFWILLPLRTGYHLFVLAHVVLNFAAGLYLFRRVLRLSLPAAVVGALSFAAGGYSRAMWDTHNLTALPWMVLGLALLLKTGTAVRPRWPVVALALTWCMMLLTGQWADCVAWAGLALTVALVHPQRKRVVASWAAGVTIGLLLAAPQVLPALDAARYSYRIGMGAVQTLERSLNPLRYLELVVPYLFGTHGQWYGESLALAGTVRTQPWSASIHIGAVALCLAVLSLASRRRKRTALALLLLSAAALLLSAGGFLPAGMRWVWSLAGGLVRYPERLIVWSSLGLATLSALGTNRLAAGLRHQDPAVRRRLLHLLAVSFGVAGLLAVTAAAAAREVGVPVWWAARRAVITVILVALAAAAVTRRAGLLRLLVALVFLESFVQWFTEQPTARLPGILQPPEVARIIAGSEDPDGRYLSDPNLRNFPMEAWEVSLREQPAVAAMVREKVMYNSGLLWGIRSCHGYSPVESHRLFELRRPVAGTFPNRNTGTAELASFIHRAGVRWLLTTGSRYPELLQHGLEAQVVRRWGDGRILLLHLPEVPEVEIHSADQEVTARALNYVWHRRAGWVRIDLFPQAREVSVTVKQAWDPGWRAEDDRGQRLRIRRSSDGMITIAVPPAAAQIRLSYRPRMWLPGVALFFIGLAALVACIPRASLVAWLKKPVFPSLCAGLVFLVLGLFSSHQWSVTMDESFHTVRGLARILKNDSRLSYLHPPLANILHGYFAWLAYQDRIVLPQTPAWRSADSLSYSVDVAYANRRIWPELIRAARWGTIIFSILSLVVVVLWAAEVGGASAAWLTGSGAATFPLFLAHGNLATLDAPLCFWAIGGTWLLWRYRRSGRLIDLLFAGVCYAMAALTKFAGLIWLLSYLVALLFIRQPANLRGRLLVAVGVLLVFLAGLISLYGIDRQAIRVPEAPGLHNTVLLAGRYIEGIVSQSQRVRAGDRVYFAGRLYQRAPWWILPATLALKTNPCWLIAFAAVGLWFLLQPGICRRYLIVVIPSAVVLASTIFLSRTAHGARYLLWLPLLLLPATAARICRLSLPIRRFMITLLLAASFGSALGTHPRYLSYLSQPWKLIKPAEYWLADSNYDWGQDLDRLEQVWPRLIRENRGGPPYLAYFGFLDPVAFYHLPVASGSLRGYCGWRTCGFAAPPPSGETLLVVSHSAAVLQPYGWSLPEVHLQSLAFAPSFLCSGI